MAVIFLEPGGDADFAVNTTNGFWKGGIVTSVTVATDFVHGTHVKSLKFGGGSGTKVETASATIANAGARISLYVYINTMPSASCGLFSIYTTPGGTDTEVCTVKITNAGVLQLWQNNTSNQIGSNGSTLSTGTWYRLCLSYTITSGAVNEFRLYKDSVSDISVTNATLTTIGVSRFRIGLTDGTVDFRTSDHYIDDSTALTDTGDVWVTAKRPISNGTLNEFTTQVGTGTPSYGSGHAPQVNERELNAGNAWSIQNAVKKTEQYTIEGASIGDMNITGKTIVDYVGWVSCKVGSSSTGNIIVNNVATNISVTTANAIFTKVAGSTTYPAGNTDIGIDTNTVNQLFTLNECGILIAFIGPPVPRPTIQGITSLTF